MSFFRTGVLKDAARRNGAMKGGNVLKDDSVV